MPAAVCGNLADRQVAFRVEQDFGAEQADADLGV